MLAKDAHWRTTAACAVLLVLLAGAGGAWSATATPLRQLLDEAEQTSPELIAARQRALAAEARIAPSAALEDPMAEVGIVNAPLAPLGLRREDMTMKMIGLSQRLPYPGKRALRRDVAKAEAASLSSGASDTRDQILRDIRMTYEELAATDAEVSVTKDMTSAVADYVNVAEAAYAVGRSGQTDVLQAEVQRTRLRQQQLELQRRRTELQATLSQLVGREPNSEPIEAMPQALRLPLPNLAKLIAASAQRPRALAASDERARAQSQIALMRREFYPDTDVKLSYGRRERTPQGVPRDDMISLTFAVNLPIWRKQRLEPQLAEARASLAESEAMLRALQLQTVAELTKRHAAASQAKASVALFDTEVLPAAEAAVNSALAAYRVGRVDFLTLLETRMRLFEGQMGRVGALSEYNRALADLYYLAGLPSDGEAGER